MTRTDYLATLDKYLRKLPQEDYLEAMEYYTEYFDEAGPDNEAQVIKELGSPREVANATIASLLDKKMSSLEKRDKTGFDKMKLLVPLLLMGMISIWLFLSFLFDFEGFIFGIGLFVLALITFFVMPIGFNKIGQTRVEILKLVALSLLIAPIGIPVFIALLVTLCGVIIAVLVFFLAALGVSIGFFILGGTFLWEVLTILPTPLPVAFMGLGAALSSFGGALLLLLVTLFFMKQSLRFIRYLSHKLIRRRTAV